MYFHDSENFQKLRGKVDALGPLERRLMELMWSRGELSGRDIYGAFAESLAYTTVMTTLDRLHQKGLLRRRLEGRAYFYAPTISGAEFERAVARGVLEQLLERAARQSEPLLSCIVEAVTEHDQELLDELDRLIQAKRRQLQQNQKQGDADAI